MRRLNACFGASTEGSLFVQTKGLAQPGYMDVQTDINEKMREILVDWIIEVDSPPSNTDIPLEHATYSHHDDDLLLCRPS